MSLTRRRFLGSLGAGAAGAAAVASLAGAQELPGSARELWRMLRAQPLLDPDLTWLDTASYGPSLRGVLIEEYRQREALSTDRNRYLRERCGADAARQLLGTLAQFVGASTDDLVFTSGATEALNLVAAGLDFSAGDEILTTIHDHPAAVYPWLLQAKRRGLKVVQIPLPSPVLTPAQIVEAFAAALTPRTRLICFSHVQYTDGCVLPVREVCALARAHNVLTLVDGAQAVGMLPLELRALGCDFYATSLHKWLNGPAGTGLLYFGDLARFRVWPAAVAGHAEWDAVDRFGVTQESSSTAFRAGWPAALRKFSYDFQHTAPLLHAVAPALALQQETGLPRVAARIRELAWYLRLELQRIEGVRVLTPSHPELWAGIVSFHVPGIAMGELVAKLAAEDRIVVQRVQHAGAGFDAIRASPHIYNDPADLDRLARALRSRMRA